MQSVCVVEESQDRTPDEPENPPVDPAPAPERPAEFEPDHEEEPSTAEPDDTPSNPDEPPTEDNPDESEPLEELRRATNE